MNRRIVTITLATAAALSALAMVPQLRALRLPGNNRGFEPGQPIEFSHRLHAGELGVACIYCHSGAETSRHAGIPAASTCMNCHRFVTAARSSIRAEEELAKKEKRKPKRVVAPELEKLYRAMALGPAMKPDPRLRPVPVQWTRIHKVPDFVYFDHRAHVAAGLPCQKCHGPVETMERVRQVETLGMGWCVSCHRGQAGVVLASGKNASAPTDCSTCHY